MGVAKGKTMRDWLVLENSELLSIILGKLNVALSVSIKLPDKKMFRLVKRISLRKMYV